MSTRAGHRPRLDAAALEAAGSEVSRAIVVAAEQHAARILRRPPTPSREIDAADARARLAIGGLRALLDRIEADLAEHAERPAAPPEAAARSGARPLPAHEPPGPLAPSGAEAVRRRGRSARPATARRPAPASTSPSRRLALELGTAALTVLVVAVILAVLV